MPVATSLFFCHNDAKLKTLGSNAKSVFCLLLGKEKVMDVNRSAHFDVNIRLLSQRNTFVLCV